jgi:hypothetical protein
VTSATNNLSNFDKEIKFHMLLSPSNPATKEFIRVSLALSSVNMPGEWLFISDGLIHILCHRRWHPKKRDI